jgi:DNA-binding NarL/FixJ family response regulator
METVRIVGQGGTWFEELKPEINQSPLVVNDFKKKYKLTDRETEIIRKIAGGFTTKEIALQLYVSEFTINTHSRNICRKLNTCTPVSLLNFAKQHGLVS